MPLNSRRLDRLASTFHRLRPPAPTTAERLAEDIRHMTTAERLARLRELEAEAAAADPATAPDTAAVAELDERLTALADLEAQHLQEDEP